MTSDVMGLHEVDRTMGVIAGGKGANLGELSRIDGVEVPPGFVLTTAAWDRVVGRRPELADHLDALAHVDPDDTDGLREVSAAVRGTIERTPVPDDLAREVTDHLVRLGTDAAFAVRSSATAEDLLTASFAGQHDTFLDVVGPAAVLRHISRCWASLFTDRAVAYRRQAGIDHRAVSMAVVVQRMVRPRSSGVMFTADPISGHRRTTTVEAVPGLGDALVDGTTTPDTLVVRDGRVVDRRIATDRKGPPVLTDEQGLALARTGERIEAHFGAPQDIEWCLTSDGDLQVVQSRPITTLFPIPDVDDDNPHVYVSVGHQQMMTDPMTPLGISVWQLTSPAPMRHAGSRLFVDVTPALASPATRDGIIRGLGTSDPLIGDALRTVVAREGFLPSETEGAPSGAPPTGPAAGPSDPIATDPAIVAELIRTMQAANDACVRRIDGLTGTALIDFVTDDLQALRTSLFDPRSHQVIVAGFEATSWLNEHLREWLGERNAADTLAQSAPGNITADMGLALLDVADAIRPHPAVVAFLERVGPDTDDAAFLDELARLPGGPQARAAIDAFLDVHGVRCVGEIDIARPRWRERPALLVPMILANARTAEPGAAQRRVELGQQQARAMRDGVLARLRALPDGDDRAEAAERMIDRLRTFVGYREYPKYAMVSRYWIHRQALVREADRLLAAGVIDAPDDIHFLTLQELRAVVDTQRLDRDLVTRRRTAFAAHHALAPPRVLTSDGEIIGGDYRRTDLPAGALAGIGVSAGTVEGRARVIQDIAHAQLEPGDILVTPFTDPSWTPAFLRVDGLVTEVGGLMTHGAVIAREYGLPAVVGVEHATRLIRDGQRIRVHGADGYVEIVP